MAHSLPRGEKEQHTYVAGPAEADDDEELPLIPSHAYVLNGAVEDSCFGFIDRINGAFWDGAQVVDANGNFAS